MSAQQEPSRLAWLAHRLGCMSFAEMRWRIGQRCGPNGWMRRRLDTTATPRPELLQTAVVVFARPEGIDAAPYLLEANAILAGTVPIFVEGQLNVGAIPDWNRHPQTGADAPADNKPDIKYVWELNRHLQWVRLAQAYVLSNDEHCRRGLVDQITAWLDQCPPLSKPNWSSAMELAIRLMNWSVVWQLLGGSDGHLFTDAGGARLRERWLDSIYAHCRFINGNFSRYSSANNHLIGELAGLYVAARTWPFATQSANWAAQAKAELEREATAQHFADGVNREQAFAYQGFSFECLAIAGVYGQRGGDPFSSAYRHTLRRALRVLRSVSDIAGTVPQVGDADDGVILQLEPRSGQTRCAALLALGEAVYGAGTTAFANDSARWLLRDAAAALPTPSDEPVTDWAFPDGGYFLFGSKFGESSEIKGFVDCGPLGYLGIAAHGHADALAIGLSIAGEACLIDPGTFSYGGDYRWRNYFRGTSAHNTIRVDGEDQSVSGGRFLWTRKAVARVEKMPMSPAQFDFTGSHDGYLRLRDPVHHVRSVCYDDAQTTLRVTDHVTGKTSHDIEQLWHFAPTIQVEINGRQVLVSGKRFEVQMHILGDNLDLELVRGREHPPLGWYSRSYGAKEPTTALKVHTLADKVSIEVRFTITIFNATFSRPYAAHTLQ